MHDAFADAFNRRDRDALAALLDADATAEVLGAPFPLEVGRERIQATSLPHLLDETVGLVASTVDAGAERWVVLRTEQGHGPIDTAVHLEHDGTTIHRLAYVTGPHQPERLHAIGSACGLPTVADAG